MILSPIVIFAFNRPEALRRCITFLLKNPEAKDSDLFVFVDGAREDRPGEKEKVIATQNVAKSIDGFKSITVKYSNENKGLATSIISGTTEVINIYGKVIVLEDDLRPLPNFLCFMNQMLDKYENEQKVFQVSGFGIKIKRPNDYPYDMYFHYRAHSWSWGTWKNRWDTVDWEVKTFDRLSKSRKLQHAFNRGGSDLFGMLKGYMTGKNNSWYIRFNYEMHLQGKLGIAPIHTLVLNEGFGEDATHCNGFNRYKVEPGDDKLRYFKCNPVIAPNERICKQVVFYWSIPYRIYGKIMNLIHRG